MAIRIGSNTTNLQVQRALSAATASVSESYARLSSGQRIIKASDDSAGLGIATQLKSDAILYQRAGRNIRDGVSLLTVASTALEQMQAIALRQRELATQAANGVYSLQQRRALDQEAKQLTDEFNRIASSTSFNGLSLLDATITNVALQAGRGVENVLNLDVSGSLTRTTGDGTFSTGQDIGGAAGTDVAVGDMNNDGFNDVVALDHGGMMYTYLSRGDGTFQAPKVKNFGDNYTWHLSLGDFNGDGIRDVAVSDVFDDEIYVHKGTGTGTYTFSTTLSTASKPRGSVAGDFNGDGVDDLFYVCEVGASGAVALSNGNATFTVAQTIALGGSGWSAATTDLNGDGCLDIAASFNGGVAVYLNRGNGTFDLKQNVAIGGRGVTTGDFNHDGIPDLASTSPGTAVGVAFGNGDGSFQTAQNYTVGSGMETRDVSTADFNGDGVLDLVTADNGSDTVTVLIGNRDGTFADGLSLQGANTWGVATGDFNSDGGSDIAVANQGAASQLFFSDTRRVTAMPYVNLCTVDGAKAAMEVIDGTLARVQSQQSSLGAQQSRLNPAANVSDMRSDNFAAAAARITDIDVAEETARMIKNSIVQQAAAAVLAQAGLQTSIALTLLRDF